MSFGNPKGDHVATLINRQQKQTGETKKKPPPLIGKRSQVWVRLNATKILVFSFALLFLVWFFLIRIKISHSELEDEVRRLKIKEWDEQAKIIPLLVLEKNIAGFDDVERYVRERLGMIYPDLGATRKIIVEPGSKDDPAKNK